MDTDPLNIPNHGYTLSPDDARLLDLLIEHGPQALPEDEPRAEKLLAVWGLIGNWPSEQPRAELVSQTVARLSEIDRQPLPARSTSISPADADLIDAMVESGQLSEAVGPTLAGNTGRAEAIRHLLSFLQHDPTTKATPSINLSTSTLSRIQAYESQTRTLRISEATASTRSNSSVGQAFWRRVGSVAALLMLGASVLLPVLNKAQADAEAVACRDNLREAGQGLAAYSQAHDGNLPNHLGNTFGVLARFAEATPHQSPADGSISATPIDLYLLPKQGYVAESNLTCPSATKRTSASPENYYNAQNALAGEPIRLSDLDAPLLADNSPLYRRIGLTLVRNDHIAEDAVSPNHAGMGQNLMNHDGSATWTIRPAVQRQGKPDLIWVRESGLDPDNVFLTP